ncbi:hypothetical protein PQF33_51430, partial [Dactylosporangium aurantiacum]|uniref:hypothetical protein n=1 Tax=Dactylosporangium aurantiacum TaxID=35754 RepID=UPI0024354529
PMGRTVATSGALNGRLWGVFRGRGHSMKGGPIRTATVDVAALLHVVDETSMKDGPHQDRDREHERRHLDPDRASMKGGPRENPRLSQPGL